MGNQDRPPPNVERLEPRLTLSTLRPARLRAQVLISHAGHTDLAPAQDAPDSAPIKARSVDEDPEPDGITLPPPTGWLLRPHGGFQTPSSSGESDHGGSGLHAEKTAQPGQLAFASDHDPGHFTLVPAYLATAAPSPAATTTHDSPGMVMGSGASLRVASSMPMDHRPSAMPRMTPTRDGKPVMTPLTPEHIGIESPDQEGQSHGHDLEPGLDPELSPGAEPEISPAIAPADMPMASAEPDPERDPDASASAAARFESPAVPSCDTSPDRAGPRLAALSGVAAFLHRNLVSGRLETDDDDPAPRAGFVRGLAHRVRSLLARLRRTPGTQREATSGAQLTQARRARDTTRASRSG